MWSAKQSLDYGEQTTETLKRKAEPAKALYLGCDGGARSSTMRVSDVAIFYYRMRSPKEENFLMSSYMAHLDKSIWKKKALIMPPIADDPNLKFEFHKMVPFLPSSSGNCPLSDSTPFFLEILIYSVNWSFT